LVPADRRADRRIAMGVTGMLCGILNWPNATSARLRYLEQREDEMTQQIAALTRRLDNADAENQRLLGVVVAMQGGKRFLRFVRRLM
jgi:hypothetical protein